MKTTIDIPDQELLDAMKYSGATTKREAVLQALQAFNHKNRMEELLKFSGTCDFPTNESLEVLESKEERRR
ncbi:MAG: type II toxin-antitoxin system VapB family antitoxin [Candidatus Methylacidiphilales bacterium]|nr:type II toxin-antitoxin system VapB family antitoxin [Candidatus Methylacidiphilales bacterium]